MSTPGSLKRMHYSAISWDILNLLSKGDFYSDEFTLYGSLCRFWFIYIHCPEVRIHFLKNVDSKEMNRPFEATSCIETQQRGHKFYQLVEVNDRDVEYKTIWRIQRPTREDLELLTGKVTFVLLVPIADASTIKNDHKHVQTSLYMDPMPCLESLSSDFSNLLASGTKTDVMLKCGDSKTPAHRLVLAARSDVFSAMFSNDMMESRTGSMEIVDLEQPILDELLKYLYSGKISSLSLDTAQCLFAAGDKYAVHGLKNKCRAFLLENLDEENVFSLLLFSDIQGDKELKDATINLFVNNGALLRDDAWFKICDEHPRVAVEVYRNVLPTTT